MNPLKIKVRNFGAIPESEIDLSGIFLASISGKNGFGKSTLFAYAPLFALFGKTKNSCSVDDMVRTGTQNMLVQIEFEHQGEVYQVTRTRKLGKKSTLELQKKTSTGWESLTGTTIAETEKKIQNLLNLDANTFTASSMILQNDSGNFSNKPSGERKAILFQILGLEIYDRLRELAKEQEKQVNIKIELLKSQLLDIDNKLKELPEIQQNFQQINEQIALKSEDIKKLDAEILTLREKAKNLELKQAEIKQIQQQLNSLASEINDKTIQIINLQAQQAESLQIITQEEEILIKQAEYEKLKEQMAALKAKASRLNELEKEANQVSEEIDKAELEKAVVGQRIESLLQELSCREDLEQANKLYHEGLEKLSQSDIKQEEYNALSGELRTKETEFIKVNGLLNNLYTQYGQIQSKISILLESNCINPKEAKCKFLSDAHEASKQKPMIEEQIEQHEKVKSAILEEQTLLDAKVNSIGYDSNEHSRIKEEVKVLEAKVAQLNALSAKEEVLNNRLEQREQINTQLKNYHDKLSNLKAQIQQLRDETKEFIGLQDKLNYYESKLPEELENLAHAKAFIQTSHEQLNTLQTELEQKQELKQSLNKQEQLLGEEIGDELPKIIERLFEVEKVKELFTKELRSHYIEQGGLKEKLDNLLAMTEEKERLRGELEPTAQELIRWQTLVKAFSKNGIPALIIENAIPELERISNDILSQMANGAHSLRFETQRDLKSKDGVMETLDIIVHDWAGSRPYETFSGGEQLRIDLAIRFALAELLATRAGSKVEFVIIDEALSSQDSAHRELVIEAIKSVSNRFKMILVISHIAEVQEAFDTKIIISERGKIDVIFS